MARWFTRCFTKSLSSSKSPSAAPPAQVSRYEGPEPLEDRFVLSSLLVTNLNSQGPGSLRQAVKLANLHPDLDVISFAPGLHGTIHLAGTELSITENVKILGPGATVLAVSGDDLSRVFEVATDTTATIANLKISHGGAVTHGGGVLNNGTLLLAKDIFTQNKANFGGGVETATSTTLTVKNSILRNNTGAEGGAIHAYGAATTTIIGSAIQGNKGLTNGDGAGILNDGTMTITTSTIEENIGHGAVYTGGGIRNNATLTIISSTIAHNISLGATGGIFSVGNLTVTNCTIVGNTGFLNNVGGGIRVAAGIATITNSTITENVDISAGGAGGIFSSATLNLNNTVVADNFCTGNAPDVRGLALPSSSGNFIGINIGTLTGIANGQNSNRVGTDIDPLDPKLSPLQDNGGPTFTRIPLPGSPLINAGVNTAIPPGITTDQTGKTRIIAGTVDIGSVEVAKFSS